MALAGFQTKAELVYERLRDAILSGELQPGERVNIDALSRQLGISKIPLREAVQRLTTQGLVVQPNPHAGARSRRCHCVRCAASTSPAAPSKASPPGSPPRPSATPSWPSCRTARADAALLVAGDHRDLSALNRRFHTGIADATHYATLRELTDLTLLRVQHYRIGVRVEPAWEQVISRALRHPRRPAPPRRRAAERAAREHVEWQLGVELRATLDPASST